MIKERSAGAVIFREEENGKRYYLLLHYEDGQWDFVKGNIEEGESERDTVLRETKEETGIPYINFVPAFNETITYIYNNKDGQEVHKEVVFYLAETRMHEVKVSWEHKGYKWQTYDKALDQLTYDTAKKLLERANKFLIQRRLSSLN